MDKIKKCPSVVFAAGLAAAIALAFWIARAPTSFSGKLPVVGDKFPIELNAVYIIVLGPIVVAACAGALWILIANRHDGGTGPLLLRDKSRESVLLAIVFGLIIVLSALLSLQYFLILAPKDLCPSRPHFEFLWHSVQGLPQIAHCMSGTDQVNAKAPFYFEPQILQSWGHVLWPALTASLLAGAWHAWRKAPAKAEIAAG